MRRMCENLQYSVDQVLFSLTLQCDISHKPHYSWNKHNMEYMNLQIWVQYQLKQPLLSPTISPSISPLLSLPSPKQMSAATLFIPPSEKSIRDSWISDWEGRKMASNRQKIQTEMPQIKFYLGEFDHIGRVPALFPFFGFLIPVWKMQGVSCIMSFKYEDILACFQLYGWRLTFVPPELPWSTSWQTRPCDIGHCADPLRPVRCSHCPRTYHLPPNAHTPDMTLIK